MTKRLLELAASISPQTVAKCMVRVDEPPLADRNEERYSNVQSAMERLGQTFNMTITSRYRDIAAGADNGECSTRRGTYRKLKTGDGRFSM